MLSMMRRISDAKVPPQQEPRNSNADTPPQRRKSDARRRSVRTSSELDAIELVQNKLFFATHESEEETQLLAQVNPHLNFVSASQLRLHNGADPNDINLSSVLHFKDALLAQAGARGRPVVVCSEVQPSEIGSNVFLLAVFMLLEHHKEPAEIAASFAYVCRDDFIPFRDMSGLPASGFRLTLRDCLDGVMKAKEVGWFDDKTFDTHTYERLRSCGGGDMTAFGDAFIAFRCPGSLVLPGLQKPLSPGFYGNTLGMLEVRAVIRLNSPKSYDAEKFVERGIRHYELLVEEGADPPAEVVEKFLDLCDLEHARGTVGVHCTDGLGVTCTLIALWMMHRCGFTAREALAWVRMARPGAVTGMLPGFLQRCEEAGLDGNTLNPLPPKADEGMPHVHKKQPPTVEGAVDDRPICHS